MPQPHADLELRLCAGLREKTAADRGSLAALQSLRSRLHAGETLPDVCADLQALLRQVDAADAVISALRAEWHACGGQPGEALRAELAEQQSVLESLMTLLGEIQADAAGIRERLAPQLDAAARGSQMRAAYGVAGRHS